VITDLRSTESTLILPSALRGRITVVDKSGRVAVELTKDAGEPLSLALPNETYSVHVDNATGEFIATVTLDHGGELEFEQATLHRVSPEATVARGGVRAEGGERHGARRGTGRSPPALAAACGSSCPKSRPTSTRWSRSAARRARSTAAR